MSAANLFLVDAFADAPFAGNPAAVVLLDRDRSDDWLQRLAAELAAPATAFLHPGGLNRLSWFTPKVELRLCGHGTLAAAHVLWSEGLLAHETAARFETQAGELTASYDEGWVMLELPALRSEAVDAPPGLARAVGIEPKAVSRAGDDYLVELGSPDDVLAVRPDRDVLATVETRGVIVTAAGGDDADFTSRFFAPSLGIPEDHVTGTAHAALAPYWAERLGRNSLIGHQASLRGGRVRVEVRGELVALAGKARTVVRGSLLL